MSSESKSEETAVLLQQQPNQPPPTTPHQPPHQHQHHHHHHHDSHGSTDSGSSCPASAASTPSSSSIQSSQIGDIVVYHDYPHHLSSLNAATHPAPFDLRAALASRNLSGRQSNSFLYDSGAQFKLQVCTGPIIHSDYHIQTGEEWLYVLDGEALVQLLDGSKSRSVVVGAGSCYLIPGGTPKSIQCTSTCTMLVMTRERKKSDTYPHPNKAHASAHLKHANSNAAEPEDPADVLLWRCQKCGGVAHKQEFNCSDFFYQSSSLIHTFDELAAVGGIRCDYCQAEYPRQFKTVLYIDNTTPHGTAAASEDIKSVNSATDVQKFIEAVHSVPSELPAKHAAFPVIDTALYPAPYELFAWIAANKHLFAPPVCNRMIHGRGTQWKVMVVTGPNQRTDYHIDDGEEWFLMLRGDMNLKLIDQAGTQFRDCIIRQGESFLLPANIPHSPQRLADTLGLVIERERFSYELDGLRWHCADENCRALLHTFSFKCADLGSQLKQLIEHWYADTPESVQLRTCTKCGKIETKPTTLDQIKQFSH